MSIIIYDGDDTAADWWPEPTDDPTPPAFPEWNRRRAEAGLRPGTFSDLMEHVINGVIGAMTQRLAELEEALDEARGGMEIHRAISAAANRRVAELEAALDAERAAWQWRPVTEDWPHYHDRVVIAHWGGTWAQFARRVQSDDGEDEWLLDDGRKFDFESASVALLTSPPPLPH